MGGHAVGQFEQMNERGFGFHVDPAAQRILVGSVDADRLDIEDDVVEVDGASTRTSLRWP